MAQRYRQIQPAPEKRPPREPEPDGGTFNIVVGPTRFINQRNLEAVQRHIEALPRQERYQEQVAVRRQLMQIRDSINEQLDTWWDKPSEIPKRVVEKREYLKRVVGEVEKLWGIDAAGALRRHITSDYMAKEFLKILKERLSYDVLQNRINRAIAQRVKNPQQGVSTKDIFLPKDIEAVLDDGTDGPVEPTLLAEAKLVIDVDGFVRKLTHD